MVFSCFAVCVLANNTRVVPYFESCMAACILILNTASKFGILDDFCEITNIFTRSFDPFPNNQPFIKIGKSSKLFMHNCPISMCASCAIAHIVRGARFGSA